MRLFHVSHCKQNLGKHKYFRRGKAINEGRRKTRKWTKNTYIKILLRFTHFLYSAEAEIPHCKAPNAGYLLRETSGLGGINTVQETIIK